MSWVEENIFEPINEGIDDTLRNIDKGWEELEDNVFEQDWFKYAVVAAGVYFGGAGLMSMSNGGSFMAGATNASSTWSSALGLGEAAVASKATAPTIGTATTATEAATLGETLATAETAKTAGTIAKGVEGAGGVIGATEAGMSTGQAMWNGAKLTAGTQGVGMLLNAHAAQKEKEEAEKRRKERQFFGVNGYGQGDYKYNSIMSRPDIKNRISPSTVHTIKKV